MTIGSLLCNSKKEWVTAAAANTIDQDNSRTQFHTIWGPYYSVIFGITEHISGSEETLCYIILRVDNCSYFHSFPQLTNWHTQSASWGNGNNIYGKKNKQLLKPHVVFV